jgi:hypothetical protein
VAVGLIGKFVDEGSCVVPEGDELVLFAIHGYVTFTGEPKPPEDVLFT